MKTAAALLIVGFVLAPLAAEAQSYRCTGKDGKKYYGQSVPMECLGLPVVQLNAQGMVTKRFDAAASDAEREKKAAEEDERKKREAITKEEGRRNRALLATYTGDKDIEEMRGRALKDNEAAVKEIQQRIAALKTRLEELKKELDFYQGKKNPGQARRRHPERRIRNHDAGRPAGREEAGRQHDQRTLRRRQKRYIELTKGGKK